MCVCVCLCVCVFVCLCALVNVTEYVGRIIAGEPMVVELSESETQKTRTSCGKLFLSISSGVLAIGDMVPTLADTAALQRRGVHVGELATSPHAAAAAAAAASTTASSAPAGMTALW